MKRRLPPLLLGLAWLLACGGVRAGTAQAAPEAAGPQPCIGHCGHALGHAAGVSRVGHTTGTTSLLSLVDAATGAQNPADFAPDFDALAGTQMPVPGWLSLATGAGLEFWAAAPAGAGLGAAPGAFADADSALPRPTLGLVLLAAIGLCALGVQARLRKAGRRR